MKLFSGRIIFNNIALRKIIHFPFLASLSFPEKTASCRRCDLYSQPIPVTWFKLFIIAKRVFLLSKKLLTLLDIFINLILPFPPLVWKLNTCATDVSAIKTAGNFLSLIIQRLNSPSAYIFSDFWPVMGWNVLHYWISRPELFSEHLQGCIYILCPAHQGKRNHQDMVCNWGTANVPQRDQLTHFWQLFNWSKYNTEEQESTSLGPRIATMH